MRITPVVLLAIAAAASVRRSTAEQPDAKEIIQRSVQANQRDFEQDPHFNHKERDRNQNGDHTYEVMMLDGWPYNRLIGINGKPLPDNAEQQQKQKQEAEKRRRDSMSEQDRHQAVQKYETGRRRNQTMMDQLAVAFNFQLLGARTLKGRSVWALKATPKAGYQAPNRDAQVLTGMQGELWIDQKTYQWVRVTAQVINPVSIEGFLATVEPGTRFELDKMEVNSGYWAAAHFMERADAKVLYFFSHREHEDDTFWDYTPVK